jgi:hypothetical protein
MPTIINADTATGGAIITGDTSGQLQLQSGGVTALTTTGANVAVTGNLTVTGAVTSSGGIASPLAVAGNSTAGAEIRLPEDTDNGSNYVALKAPDTLAANLTLTLPTADGTSGQFLQTNGSGQLAFVTPASGTQQFTSSGSITAGQPVSLNSNGTVSTTTGIDQAATFNTATSYGSGSQYVFGSFYDSSTGWHFTGFRIGSYAYLLSYKVSAAGAITNVNSAGIFNFDATNYRRGVIVKDTTADRVMFLVGGSANDYAGTVYMQAFNFNTSTGALTAAGFTSVVSTSGSLAPFDAYFDSYANRTVVIGYTGSGTMNVVAYSNNGSSFSQTASTSFSMWSEQAAGIAAAFNSNTNAGRAFFRVNPYGWMGTRTISLNAAGNTFTIGAEAATYGANFSSNGRAAYFPSIDRFIVQYAASGSATTILINPSTGSSVTTNSTLPVSNLYYSWEAYGFCNSYDTVGNVVYNTSSSTAGGVYTWSYTLTASSITYTNGSSYTANSYLARGTAITYDPTLGRGGITAYDYSAGNTLVIGFLPAQFSTNADKFIGFSTQSVSTGAAVTVTTLGGVNTNQSALTTNAAYYIQLTGALSTTPSQYGIVARALSATSVQVTTGGAFKKIISQTVIAGSPSSITLTLPSGYSQFELTFQNVRGGTTGQPVLGSANSAGGNNTWYGRGWYVFGSSSYNFATQSATQLNLAPTTHSAGSPFGGSLLLQSSASSSVWSYQMVTSYSSSGDGWFSASGYVDSTPVTLTFSALGTLTNGGVITLYGIG